MRVTEKSGRLNNLKTWKWLNNYTYWWSHEFKQVYFLFDVPRDPCSSISSNRWPIVSWLSLWGKMGQPHPRCGTPSLFGLPFPPALLDVLLLMSSQHLPCWIEQTSWRAEWSGWPLLLLTSFESESPHQPSPPSPGCSSLVKLDLWVISWSEMDPVWS